MSGQPDCITAGEALALATENGACAQGRADTGRIAVGARADLALLDLRGVHNMPHETPEAALCYSAAASDVCMTVVDGRILYENGAFSTLDVEKLKKEFAEMRAHYFD
jgi:5-methylthioadenosine/S-adenosylhomocysteine deaminase